MMCDDIVERTETNERLKRNGWKVYADTTLGQWKKKDLIDLIRCLEYNYSAVIERWERTVQSAESKIRSWNGNAEFQKVLKINKINEKTFAVQRANIEVLKVQIEKMKCCQNCKHSKEEWGEIHCTIDYPNNNYCSIAYNTENNDLWEMKK